MRLYDKRMEFLLSACTDIGLSKATNQDSYAAKLLKTEQGSMVFAVLCDGMGGLEKGEVASATLVRAFSNWVEHRLPELLQRPLSDHIIREEWEMLVHECNQKIRLHGKRSAVNLGTTLTCILITQDRYYVMNIGDSRTYEISDSLRSLTKDQTIVQREIDQGIITEEEAKYDPRRSVLLQCVGVLDQVYPDMFFGQPKVNAVYMLCSDGFRHEISEEELFQFLQPNQMTNVASMDKNMNYLIQMNMQREEKDNITVLSIRTYE